MKDIILFFSLLYFACCQTALNEGEIIEFYTNYTLYAPTKEKNLYYFYPYGGIVHFHITFTNRDGNPSFSIYNMDESQRYALFYGSVDYTVPSDNPQILKFYVTKTGWYPNYDIFYLYVYNTDYKIPLSISNYYLYRIIIKNLEINYKIDELSEDNKIVFDAKIENPQYTDKFKLNMDGQNYTFEKTDSLQLELKKGKSYSIKFKADIQGPVSLNSYFFIYLGKDRNYNDLFYKTNNLTFPTVITDIKWYIVDTINLIDNYNHYNFSMVEGFQNDTKNIFNIKIKKYDTYDINYIKEHTPDSDEDYDEKILLEYDKYYTFKACEDTCLNYKTILIEVDLNYQSDKSTLYKYNIARIDKKSNLQDKSYNINWNTLYNFSPMDVKNQDIILISTNHTNTIFPLYDDNNKVFKSLYNGYLFVSFSDSDINRNKVAISYSDEEATLENDQDIGHLEVYILKEKMTFEIINIEESFETQLYAFELIKSEDKYYYIKIIGYDEFYILYEGDITYSFLTIQKMPVDIIKLEQSDAKNGTILMTNKNEYILKVGYSKYAYDLVNMYIIKNEMARTFDLEEGDIKMVTYSIKDSKVSIQINILEEKITEKSYVNLKIASKEINGNLYVSYTGNTYILNNTGINIYNEKKQYQLYLAIENKDTVKGILYIFSILLFQFK